MGRMEWGGFEDHVVDPPGCWVGNCCQIQCSVGTHVVLATPQIILKAVEYFSLYVASVESVLIRNVCVETSV